MYNLTADEDLMRFQESNVCIRSRDFAGDVSRATIDILPYEQNVLSGALVVLPSTEAGETPKHP
jgi:hypothetical protein